MCLPVRTIEGATDLPVHRRDHRQAPSGGGRWVADLRSLHLLRCAGLRRGRRQRDTQARPVWPGVQPAPRESRVQHRVEAPASGDRTEQPVSLRERTEVQTMLRTMKTESPTGYTCGCLTFHWFSPWVYAHWRATVVHRCLNCGRSNRLRLGLLLKRKMKGKR